MIERQAGAAGHGVISRLAARVSRRQVLQRAAALGLSVPALSMLLGACGESSQAPEGTAAPGGGASGDGSAATKTATAAESGDSSTGRPTDTTLRVGSVADITTFHPARLGVAADRMAAGMLYSTLVRMNFPSSDIVPDLADKWERSPDGKVYTFNLREGVQFHGGYGELTSADVKFSIAFYQDKDGTAKSRVSSLYDAVESVETPDPYTIVINLSEPFVSFIQILAWQAALIVSEAAATELGEDLAHQPIGTGPFELTSWSQGQELVFSRFDDYFGEQPQVSEVRVKIIADQSTQILAIPKGELDAVYISTIPALKTARATDKVNVLEQPSTWTNIAWLQQREGPTTSPELRQAMAHAIDTKSISEASAGFSQPSVTMLPPMCFGYTTDVPTYPYDPERARDLLSQSGYSNEPIGILYYPANQYAELAQILKEAWTQVGINAQLDQVDAATWSSRSNAGEFDVYMVGIGRNTPDEYFGVSYKTDGPTNAGGYSNPKVDDLIREARRQSDEAEAERMYAEIQRLILEDLPVIPISNQLGVWAVGPRIKTFVYDHYANIARFQSVEFA